MKLFNGQNAKEKRHLAIYEWQISMVMNGQEKRIKIWSKRKKEKSIKVRRQIYPSKIKVRRQIVLEHILL